MVQMKFPPITSGKKDGPGPVMVSSTLCPAVHILGSQNVCGRAEGIADHYWPWAVFYELFCQFFCQFFACLWSLVVVLEEGSIPQERGECL